MEEKNQNSRRSFIQKSAAATALLTIPNIIPAHAFGANDRVNAAVLGVNGRGKSHIEGLMEQKNVEITTFVDPDLVVGNKRAEEFEKKYGKKVNVVQDMRKAFDDKNIHVVTVATPNHWHTLATIRG